MEKNFFTPDTTFPDGPTIRQRVGVLCWWICNCAAVLTVAGTLVVKVLERTWWDEAFFYVAGSLWVAGVIWSTGRGALILFAGR